MQFENCSINELMLKTKGKKVACFGASKYIDTFSQKMNNNQWTECISFFVDNNVDIQGKEVTYFGKTWKVFAPEYLRNQCDFIIIATAIGATILEIVNQLQLMCLSDEIKCYSLLMMRDIKEYNNSILFQSEMKKNMQISKMIHSFWFSKDEKPISYQKCIESWKRYCPEYEIIEWNSDNYDVSKNQYMEKAYENKMWAFVSDYARLDVVYRYGGIYMDMDVEILRNLDDILYNKGFFSFDNDGYIDLGSGFGAIKGLPFIKSLLDVYENIEFAMEGIKINPKVTIPQPARLLPYFQKLGYKQNNSLQIIDDMVFYSPDFFRVIDDTKHEDRKFSGNEYAVHWHHAGWFDSITAEERENRIKIKNRLKEIFIDDNI